MRGALSYNERKISRGEAELLLASRFGCELPSLGFTEKLNRFQRLNNRSQTVTTNTLHLSLNFSPYDKLDDQKLQAIAVDYMNRIGFGNQPFLVYRHDDTAHPHIHILTSIIRPNGRPIDIHNIGKLKSEPARKDIEREYDLIPAESMKREVTLPLYPASLDDELDHQKSKLVISNIVMEVTSLYHFTSLDELNAILKDYNIVADPGIPGSRMRENGGLVYSRVWHGNKIGTPVKASSIYGQPTLKFLQRKFKRELQRKHLYATHTAGIVKSLLEKPLRFTETRFKQILAKRKVRCEIQRDTQGQLLDIRFIDHFSKTVLSYQDIKIPIELLGSKLIQDRQKSKTENKQQNQPYSEPQVDLSQLTLKLLKGLLVNENEGSGISPEFLKKKRKKRKGN
ncbi:relaxase/mobilization nuclease domain-containing protein [Chitinophaga cymbidii]|uniref:Relaxase n=1 Tax=Chitinophaga cymbidii TaxID=1096750 RepID=A0A512RPT1_9BACT|nr:relaxase/mobilization nuclease domain-containing protein [Chitinophaga cymbidii]GEP97706.1 relaxase [Chitinophaga cymbidii]